MKKITILFLCIFMILIPLSASVSAAAPYSPLKQTFLTLTTDEKPLPADFVKYGSRCWFNELEVKTAENVFTWKKLEDGSNGHCLMILIDVSRESAGNKSLHIPKYGQPEISIVLTDLLITWVNPADPGDMITLTFRIGGKEMTFTESSSNGNNKRRDIDLPVGAYESSDGPIFIYVPLYAILNAVGGGVMYDPFGDGMAFIYTGSALQGYSGVWEVTDDSEYRIDVEMDGKTVSVANYWWLIELRPDGNFTEVDRHYKDEGGWFRTDFKGKYAFFGRILAMKYISESLYIGEDFNSLEPYKVNEPFESYWGSTDDVYAIYIDDWQSEDVLNMRGARTLYSKELSGRKW